VQCCRSIFTCWRQWGNTWWLFLKGTCNALSTFSR